MCKFDMITSSRKRWQSYPSVLFFWNADFQCPFRERLQTWEEMSLDICRGLLPPLILISVHSRPSYTALGHSGKAVSSLWCLLRWLREDMVYLTLEPTGSHRPECSTYVWHLDTFPYVSTGEVYSSFWMVICLIMTHCNTASQNMELPRSSQGAQCDLKDEPLVMFKNFLKNYFALPCVESQLSFSSCEVLFSFSSSTWGSFLK